MKTVPVHSSFSLISNANKPKIENVFEWSTCKSNFDILTSNVHDRRYQGVMTPSGDFFGLGPDGELQIIPPEAQRPWLSDSAEDRNFFFAGLQIGTAAPAALVEQTCAMCATTHGLQRHT